jgi:hypothetical protein
MKRDGCAGRAGPAPKKGGPAPPALHGKQAIFAYMASGRFALDIPILQTMTSFSTDLLHIASHGDILVSERIDHHWDAEGGDLMTPPICSVTELHGCQELHTPGLLRYVLFHERAWPTPAPSYWAISSACPKPLR